MLNHGLLLNSQDNCLTTVVSQQLREMTDSVSSSLSRKCREQLKNRHCHFIFLKKKISSPDYFRTPELLCVQLSVQNLGRIVPSLQELCFTLWLTRLTSHSRPSPSSQSITLPHTMWCGLLEYQKPPHV